MTDKITTPANTGMAGMIAGTSSISQVDPTGDKLTYRGYDAHDLADKSSFEEVAYLLLNGKLPSAKEFKDFKTVLLEERKVVKASYELFKQLPQDSHPMDRLRTVVSYKGLFDPDRDDHSHEANVRKAIRIIARMPFWVAGSYLIPMGKEVPEPHPEFSHSKNFLYMLTGKEPDDLASKVFDASLILYAEHGFNASTFAGRVTIATESDIYSAVTSSVGTLKGSLHGGANENAMRMLLEIGEKDKAESWIKNALEQKKKIMGFGHRVYKGQDSRAPILSALSRDYAQKTKNTKWLEIAEIVEKVMMKEKKLFPNVDFPCASLYYNFGLPVEIYTPIFAAARSAGWCAHDIEQLDNNKLIRPKCEYIGERDLAYVPLSERKD